MKKILLGLAICAVSGLAYGQGLVTISTGKANTYVRFSNTVASAWASGNSVVWGLYYGTTAGTYDHLLTSPTNGFYSGTSAGFMGCITSSGGVKALETAPGVTTYFQLKAWSAGYASYEAALASGLDSVLISKTILSATDTPGQPTGSPPPTPPTILWAPGTASATAQIVQLVPVPEPSIIALAGLGLAGLIFIRRRK